MVIERSDARDRQIRVAVVDRHDLMREGLQALLDGSEQFMCVGSWASEREAILAIHAIAPDVVLLDAEPKKRIALRFIDAVPTVSPHTRTIVMVDCGECRHATCPILNAEMPLQASPRSCSSRPHHSTAHCSELAQKLGPAAVLRKRSSFSEIARAISAAGAFSTAPPRLFSCTEQRPSSSSHAGPIAVHRSAELSPRERHIALLIARGMSNKAISAELRLAYSTVKNYVSSILEKLGLEHRTQIAVYALSLEMAGEAQRP